MNNIDDLASFRFRPINKYVISELVNSQLYFCPPEKLNDPYDCQIDLVGLQQNALAQNSEIKLSLKTLNDLQEKVKEIGIVCFSGNQNNLSMWANYADNHKGICLRYEIPANFIISNSNELLGWSCVDYSYNSLKNAILEFTSNSDFKDIITKMMTVKSEHWSHEDEFRIVKAKAGLFNVPRNFLKQICFGINTPSNDIELIHQIINSYGYKNIVFAQMKRDSSFDFGFNATKLDLII